MVNMYQRIRTGRAFHTRALDGFLPYRNQFKQIVQRILSLILCHKAFRGLDYAGVAQLVEQLIRNQQVSSSSLLVGSMNIQGIQVFIPESLFLSLHNICAYFGIFKVKLSSLCKDNLASGYKNERYLCW